MSVFDILTLFGGLALFLYVVLLFVVIKSDPSAMAAYVPIVLGTATLNSIIVAALYVPLMKVLKKEIVKEENV